MIKIFIGNSLCKTQWEDNQEQLALYNSLLYKIPNIQQIKKRTGNWRMSEYKSFYNRRKNVFLTGLLADVVSYLQKNNFQYELIDTRTKPTQEFQPYKLKGITLYPHQEKAIESFLQHKRGVAKLPTGAGKTECAIALVKAINLPTLFLTHRVNLLYQTTQRFINRLPEYKDKIGIIGDSNFSPNFITIATVQTLFAYMKSNPKQAQELLNQYQFLIIDEAHRSGAKQFYVPASMCHNAYYRLALTATPFMNENTEEDMYLKGLTGNICAEVSLTELIQAGILAKPFFKFFNIKEPDIKNLTHWRDVYEKGIIANEKRNQIITTQATRLAQKGHKILIIIKELQHGKILKQMLDNSGVKSEYVSGKDDVYLRKKTLKKLKDNKINVVIATNIFDEGIDVEDISVVILGAGTKSAPALFQRTGRAIRKKEGGNYAIIIDFIDEQHPMLLRHSVKRFNMIKNEEAFTIL